MSVKDECSKQIVKIGTNHVELQYFLYDAKYNPVVLDDYTIPYGQPRLDDDRVEADSTKTYWDGFTPGQVAIEQGTANKAVAYYDLLQVAMDGPDGEVYAIDESVSVPED